ncbi:MAG: cellulose biosynthesis protein BcsS [Alphaproteobacteria bacterium]|nr:cellulose biosynthesis protein BcsS [Alphaproteobacteria bacterium]
MRSGKRGAGWLSGGCVRGIATAFFASVAFAVAAPGHSLANPFEDFVATFSRSSPPEEKTDRHYEIWTGADASDSAWLVYSGTTLAPLGDIHQDGLRLRFVGGYGRYTYKSFDINTLAGQSFAAEVTFADALVGYLWRLDPLILKLFVGASFSDHRIHPGDFNNRVQGPEVGVKGLAEFWFNIGEKGFASLNLAWSQAHNTRSARARLGYKITPEISLGPEIGLNVDRQGDFKISEEHMKFRTELMDYGRVGMFARYQWYGGEIAASAGLLGDFREDTSPYATVNWITQF